MKKVISLLLTVVTVLSMTYTIYAAPSPASIGSVSTSGATSNIVSSGRTVTGQAVITKTDTIMSIAELQKATDIVYRSSYSKSIVQNQNAVVISALDIAIPGGIKSGDVASVTVHVAGVNASTKLVVLHYVNGVWQEENNTCGDGIVTISNLTSCSPFLFIADKSTLTSTSNTVRSSRVKSDKTGEGNMVPLAFLVAAVAAGTIVIRRKRQEY